MTQEQSQISRSGVVDPECERCHRTLSGGLIFNLRTRAGNAVRCLRCALRYRPLLRRSLIASVVVGSILVALNQADVILSGDPPRTLFWKVPLTYLTPFLVATWGALSNARVGQLPEATNRSE